MPSTRVEGVAGIAVIAGAIASAAVTAYVGWHGARVLILPFLAWVISPFILLWWALDRARRWSPASTVLPVTAGAVSAASVAAYLARLIWPPHSQGAFVFVIVPPLAWLIGVLALLVARGPARQRP